MEITLDYSAPSEGQERLFGTYQAGEATGSFSCPLLYSDGIMDLDSTLARTKLALEESLAS